jgi:FKBP-type peptidyl-prolyl cis-trans isomerase FkpA
MNRLSLFLGLIGLWLCWTACGEDITPAQQAAIDRAEIEAYAADQGLNGTFSPEGIYYEITSGADTAAGFPGPSDTLVIFYEGSFLNGEVFDRSGDRGVADTLPLSQTIDGWREALPRFNRGASGYFILPSGLAYGPDGFRFIPPNTVLRFDVELQDFY